MNDILLNMFSAISYRNYSTVTYFIRNIHCNLQSNIGRIYYFEISILNKLIQEQYLSRAIHCNHPEMFREIIPYSYT